MINFFKTPHFWYDTRSPSSFFLRICGLPLSWIYRFCAYIHRMFYKQFVPPYMSSIPLICVGNIVAGGAGKTPTAIALARMLQDQGMKVAFISRGYGSQNQEPVQVNNAQHTYHNVGDEALNLSYIADTFVCANRVKAIKLAEQSDADILIADDGLQNLSFFKHLKILVINGNDGFGNMQILPAGPLRQTPDSILSQIDLVIMIGEDKHHLKPLFTCPVILGNIEIDQECDSRKIALSDFRKKSAVLFAGIGRPQKFFKTMKTDLSIPVVATKSYPDHYPYGIKEIDELKHLAILNNALLLTTTKDHCRLPKDFQSNVIPVKVSLILKNHTLLDKALNKVLVQPK